MARTISVHEYELKPGTDPERFEQTLRDAEALGLFDLPGLISHHFVKGVKGARRDAYAAIWVYESRDVWERLWGTPEHPKTPAEYPEAVEALGKSVLDASPKYRPRCDQVYLVRGATTRRARAHQREAGGLRTG